MAALGCAHGLFVAYKQERSCHFVSSELLMGKAVEKQVQSEKISDVVLDKWDLRSSSGIRW